tara:strand:- start:743 stop:901 length:159 start_codon:yes stop_codon:yes gene_type:complete
MHAALDIASWDATLDDSGVCFTFSDKATIKEPLTAESDSLLQLTYVQFWVNL